MTTTENLKDEVNGLEICPICETKLPMCECVLDIYMPHMDNDVWQDYVVGLAKRISLTEKPRVS